MTLPGSLTACLLGAAMLVAPGVALAQANDALTGLWNVSITSPIGVTPATLALTDDGGRLAGIMHGENGPWPIEGSRTADGITLRYSVMYEGAPLPIVLKAPSAAGPVEGSADFGGLAEGTWTASKATPDGIDGAWAFSADDGSGTPTKGHLTLIDKGGTVSGRLLVRSRGVDGVVKGTHKDGELKLTADAVADGSPITVVMPGKVNGQQIEGTFAVADLSGRWTATRP